MRRKLPFSLTLLFLLILLLTIWEAIRFVTSIAWRGALELYAPNPGPFYIGATGAFWMLAGLFLLWSVWVGVRWNRAAILIASGLYAAWVWADRLFVQAQVRANWPFDLAVTIILLAYTAAVVLNPRNRIYFERETYERESKDQPSA